MRLELLLLVPSGDRTVVSAVRRQRLHSDTDALPTCLKAWRGYCFQVHHQQAGPSMSTRSHQHHWRSSLAADGDGLGLLEASHASLRLRHRLTPPTRESCCYRPIATILP